MVGLCSKVYVQSDIWRKKSNYGEMVSFHRQMFYVTNCGLALSICMVNAMIFIKKNIDKLVQDQFLRIGKDNQYYVEKTMLVISK